MPKSIRPTRDRAGRKKEVGISALDYSPRTRRDGEHGQQEVRPHQLPDACDVRTPRLGVKRPTCAQIMHWTGMGRLVVQQEVVFRTGEGGTHPGHARSVLLPPAKRIAATRLTAWSSTAPTPTSTIACSQSGCGYPPCRRQEQREHNFGRMVDQQNAATQLLEQPYSA